MIDHPEREDRILRLVSAIVPDYTGRLGRLVGDFSAAVAFLLSDPVFDRLGCGGRQFVEFARKAYADRDPESPAEVRRRCRQLLRQSEKVLQILRSAAGQHQDALDGRRKTGEALSDTAARITAQTEEMLQTSLDSLKARAASEGVDDPERLADMLGEMANGAFDRMRDAWQPVFSELANSSLPAPPLMFSGRQMYIETVKLFNQHRLANGESATPDPKGLRGLFGGGRRASAKEAVDARARVMTSIITSMGDAVWAALGAWQRGALGRVQRKGLETSPSAGESTLTEELAIIRRAINGLSSLKRELAQGLSVRHYYLALLQQAAGCSRSA